jgi:hypothetical protein
VPTDIKPVVTVLSAKSEPAAVEPTAATVNVAPAAAIPETDSEQPVENDAADHIDIIADLDNLALDGSKAGESGEVELEDPGLSPLAELEELAKQQKK